MSVRNCDVFCISWECDAAGRQRNRQEQKVTAGTVSDLSRDCSSTMADRGDAAFIDNNTFQSFDPVENPWRIKHPVVTFFHLLFRTLALIGQ